MSDGVGAPKTINLAAEPDFRLGALLVRPSTCRVVYGHVEIRAEPRVMEVLIVLRRVRGGTVTREQLVDACWGGRAISDDAITRVIAKVRQLASGGDEPPHFQLETLPKVGYRLTDCAQQSEATPPVEAMASSAYAPAIIASAMALNGAVPRPESETPALSEGPQPLEQSRAPETSVYSNLFRKLSNSRLFFYTVAMLGLVLIVVAVQGNLGQRTSGTNTEAFRLTQAARALIHERNGASVAQAEHLLREAIAADPSYAPAWARLGHATWYPWRIVEANEPGAKLKVKAEALAYIKRALAISPNLAEAQGIMGMVQTDTKEGMPWLESAVRLDAGSPELWMWLGDGRRDNGDLRGALYDYEKARSLDPAWHYSDEPYLDIVFRLRGPVETYRDLDRMAASMNDQNWSLQERAELEYQEGRLADSAAAAMAALRAHPQNPFWARQRLVFIAATLGNKALQDRMLTEGPTRQANVLAVLRAVFNAFGRPGWAYARAQTSPETWWDGMSMGAQSLQLLSEGNSALLVTLYDQRFKNPADFVLRCPCEVLASGPTLAIALRQAGRHAEADQILSGLWTTADRLAAAGDQLLTTEVSRARIAALLGWSPAAKHLLRHAVQRGWKGQVPGFGADPSSDPAFESLRDDAEFGAIVKFFREAKQSEAERLAQIDLSGG